MSDGVTVTSGRITSEALRLFWRDWLTLQWRAEAEQYGADGELGIWFLTNAGATAWDNLGMLTWAAQKEQARASRLLGDSSE